MGYEIVKNRRSPKEVVSLYTWQNLRQSYTDIRQAKVLDAMTIYAEIIPQVQQYKAILNHPWQIISDQLIEPSWNWASVYLREYFYLRQTWADWYYFFADLFQKQNWQTISLECQSQLISTRGWASIRKRYLKEVISEQLNFLDKMKILKENQDVNLLKSMHFIVLSYAHTLSFDQSKSFKYAYQAIDLLEPSTEPYYVMRAYEILGTAFYTFGKYDEALECYYKISETIQPEHDSPNPLEPYYGRGWAYIGNRQLEYALDAFQRGFNQKLQASLYYDAARCKYGLGYTYFLLGNYLDAQQALNEALRVFCDDHFDLNTYSNRNSIVSPAMTAACLHVLALVYERCDEFEKAIKHEEQALSWQREIDDPGQLSDMLRRAIRLNLKSGRFMSIPKYIQEIVSLRLSYRIPTFCLN
jgi:tetratricopeptide (TPR) repeat protein